MSREAFERWWYGSKYMQVVISGEAEKQCALDGYQAGRAAALEEAANALLADTITWGQQELTRSNARHFADLIRKLKESR